MENTMIKNGECKICEINLYVEETKNGLTPAPAAKTFPCALNNCPYESKAEQAKNAHKTLFVPAGKWGSTFE